MPVPTISLFEFANKYAASENDSKDVASGNHREPKPNFSTLFASNASFSLSKRCVEAKTPKPPSFIISNSPQLRK